MDASTAALLTSTFGTLLVGVLNYLREGRAHTWAREAREEDLQEHRQSSQVIASKIDDAQHEIASGSAAASAAYDVANTLNEKIAAIGQVRIASEQQQRRIDDHI
jgi:hypothetical protein